MLIFRHPPEEKALHLLREASLPVADLTFDHFRHFFGCGSKEELDGVIGVEFYGSDALLRSLAVAESVRGRGCGRALVRHAERYARGYGVERLYLLTTTAAPYFEQLGYRSLSRDDAPESIRSTVEFDSLCPSDSICMMKDLTLRLEALQ